MACKLITDFIKTDCEYQIAGVKSIYLINFDTNNKFEVGEKKDIVSISLADNAKAYRVEFIDNTASWTDDLAVNGNGGKYRTHTVNFTLSQYDYTILNQDKALSLGKFTAIVVDKSGKAVVLGRNNGLSATSFNYASGAADADAQGWTTVLAGTENEIGKFLESDSMESMIKSLIDSQKEDTRIIVTA